MEACVGSCVHGPTTMFNYVWAMYKLAKSTYTFSTYQTRRVHIPAPSLTTSISSADYLNSTFIYDLASRRSQWFDF